MRRFPLRHLRVPTSLAITLTLGALASPAQAESPPPRTEDASTTSDRDAHASSAIPLPGQRLKLAPGTELIVGPGAEAEPKFTSQLPVGERGAKVPVKAVFVERGQVHALIHHPGRKSGVLLQGPEKILGISTQGHFALSITDEKVTIAAISENVLVGQASRFKPLPSGFMRVFSRVSGLSEDRPLPSPTQLTPEGGLPLALFGPAQVRIRPSRVDSKLWLALSDAEGNPVSAPQKVTTAGPFELKLPRAGTYFAVARTIDETGILSAPSLPLRLQVLGLAEGQRPPKDGIYLLRRGERLHLAGAEGLEMRYGTSPTYVPATPSIGLPRSRPTVVELRVPGNPNSSVRFRLAPDILRTKAHLGPVGATWPGEPLQMRVSLWDGAGRLVQQEDRLHLKVTVNSRPIAVDWQSTSAGLEAKLPPQAGAGPWVVRLNVSDGQGRTLARDVLDVASADGATPK